MMLGNKINLYKYDKMYSPKDVDNINYGHEYRINQIKNNAMERMKDRYRELIIEDSKRAYSEAVSADAIKLQILKLVKEDPNVTAGLIEAAQKLDTSKWSEVDKRKLDIMISLRRNNEISFISFLDTTGVLANLKSLDLETVKDSLRLALTSKMKDGMIDISELDLVEENGETYIVLGDIKMYIGEDLLEEVMKVAVNPTKNFFENYSPNKKVPIQPDLFEVPTRMPKGAVEEIQAVRDKVVEQHLAKRKAEERTMNVTGNQKTEKALIEALSMTHDKLKSKERRTQLQINKDLADFLVNQLTYLADDDPLVQKFQDLEDDWTNIADEMKQIRAANKQVPVTVESMKASKVKTAAVASVGTAVILLILKSIDWNKVVQFLLHKVLSNSNAAAFLTDGASGQSLEKPDLLRHNPELDALADRGVDIQGIAERLIGEGDFQKIMEVFAAAEAAEIIEEAEEAEDAEQSRMEGEAETETTSIAVKS